MFSRAGYLQRFRYKYVDEKLSAQLKDIFGAQTTLGSDRLRTLLMMVMRNATTDSPWPICNNPHAKFNDRSRPDCNLDLPFGNWFVPAPQPPFISRPNQCVLATTIFYLWMAA